jgi:hypothetical protein
MRRLFSVLFAIGVAGASCNGTTGDALISFTPYASGASGAGNPFIYTFVSGAREIKYSIQLTSASMYLGAVYFDESPPSTSFDSTECNTDDVFAAQVPGGVLVNLLSTAPQEFSVYGNGSADVALSWDLWLVDGDVNEQTTSPTATVTGTATLVSDPTQVFGFGAVVTINTGQSGVGARGASSSDPALPGADPICKQRILQLGGIHLGFYQGGTLHVTIDPRAWFAATDAIDFSNLLPTSNMECQLDTGSTDYYESFGPCDASGACPNGLMCNLYTASGNPSCVQPCGFTPPICPAGYVCNNADNNCIPEYCIPDTSWATCTLASASGTGSGTGSGSGTGTSSGSGSGSGSSSDVLLPSPTCTAAEEAASNAAGNGLFLGIEGGGAAAYSATYSGQSND